MKKIFIASLLLATTLTACDENFLDGIASPQTSEQEAAETVAFGNGSVTSVPTIDFATEAFKNADSVAVCKFTTPTVDASTTLTGYELHIGNVKYNFSSSCLLNKTTLENLVISTYGKRPTERTLRAMLRANYVKNGRGFYVNSDSFNIVAKPEAPVIESAYYYVGTTNGWSPTDKTYELSNGGGDVYDNPVFTVTVPAPVKSDGTRDDNWFKIAPLSAYSSDNFWNNLVGTVNNGETALTGKIIVDHSSSTVQAWNMPATDGAKYYKISVNMLDETYTIIPIKEDPYIFTPGNQQGWDPATSIKLYNGGSGLEYKGFVYLNGGFKFTGKDTWTDGYNYGAAKDGTANKLSDASDAGNLNADEGFYYADVNIKDMTYTITSITSVSLIGTVKGNWDTDVDMTFDSSVAGAQKIWTITADLNAGLFKFRMNHDWALNLGGTADALTQGGDNITLAESGNYTIVLYASYDGASHFTIKKN